MIVVFRSQVDFGSARRQALKERLDGGQGHLDYNRSWGRSSIIFRAGMRSSPFGSFLLRYDDMANPLIDYPCLTDITTRA
jgi:hypothetical protein